MALLKEQIQHIPTKWQPILSKWFSGTTKNTIEKEYQKECETFSGILPAFPPLERIFRCFHYFDPEGTKVVILGQDPYHGPGQATGLCFGVEKGQRKPPSLRNIEKELLSDLNITLEDPTLEKWAKQGVLLLNAALTVRQQTPLAHMKWWSPLTDAIVAYLNKNHSGIIFVAWGGFAHRKLNGIDLSKHHLLVSSHPSPLSATRAYREFPSFRNSRPFSQINSYLASPIHW